MRRAGCLLLLAWALQTGPVSGQTGPVSGDDELVFHSDVSLVRVDAQVVDCRQSRYH